MLKLMDETVSDEMGYTLVVCYTDVTDDNVPPMAWIREVYDMLPRKCVAVKLDISVTDGLRTNSVIWCTWSSPDTKRTLSIYMWPTRPG